MEFEQLIKRLDWLDEEHRKDKANLDHITGQLANIQAELNVFNKQIKLFSKSISSISTMNARFDQFNEALEKYRTELIKRVEDVEKQQIKNLTDTDKRWRLEFDGINRSLESLQKNSDITDLKRKIETRIQEEQRVSRILTEMDAKISQAQSADFDLQSTVKLIGENQRQETKKSTDLQSDFVSFRKKFDELKSKVDIFPDNIRRLETRLSEIVTSEAERRQSQQSFIEQQALLQIDRDHIHKELKDRIEKMGKQSQLLESQLLEWDSVQRDVKHAQEIYQEITQKFERRINEITEMQRLSEDRFRQEWVTFKADHQKRWTSYTNTQDEQYKDTQAEITKLSDRVSPVEDLVEIQKDIIQQTKEANEEYLHGLLAQIHELLSAYERIMGSTH